MNERPIEYAFVFKCLMEANVKTVLDVGTGKTALPALIKGCGFDVDAIDNYSDFWRYPVINRHFWVKNDDITAPKTKKKYDAITCISTLEHIERSELAFSNMARMLNDGGILILTFPHSNNSYRRNVYEEKDSNAFGKNIKYICQSFNREIVTSWCYNNMLTLYRSEFWKIWKGNYWSCGNRIAPEYTTWSEKHQLACYHLIKNHA
jgi:2-polyprenyl-3-methyl-5-hydroxy-6-metoxy-1,4-benzoquinol methylase